MELKYRGQTYTSGDQRKLACFDEGITRAPMQMTYRGVSYWKQFYWARRERFATNPAKTVFKGI
jgi:hypothetical protein